MGRTDKITPDVVEWLVSDDKVAAKWRSFAKRLDLEAYVPEIDADFSRRRKKLDRQKAKELFDVWRRASPITFTRSRLTDLLGKEGLTHMLMWLELMDTENSRRKSEISFAIDDSRTATPRSAFSLSPQPPNHLVRDSNSPSYSWYFNNKTTMATPSPNPSGGILKHNRNRPESATSGSDYYYTSNSRESTPGEINDLADNYAYLRHMYRLDEENYGRFAGDDERSSKDENEDDSIRRRHRRNGRGRAQVKRLQVQLVVFGVLHRDRRGRRAEFDFTAKVSV